MVPSSGTSVRRPACCTRSTLPIEPLAGRGLDERQHEVALPQQFAHLYGRPPAVGRGRRPARPQRGRQAREPDQSDAEGVPP